MKKTELRINARIQDNRTSEQYRVLGIDCFGVAYAKKIGCKLTIAIGGKRDIGTEDCRYFSII